METIDELLASAKHGEQLLVPNHWGQGRTVFGGLSAALLYQAMRNDLAPEREMRAFNVQFIGPLNADEPFTMEVEHLRDGKNVTQLQARIYQHERVSVQAMAAFGQHRESKIRVAARNKDVSSPPEKAMWVPQVPKVIPKFHRHIDWKIDNGGIPFTGSSSADYGGWMRFSEPPTAITDAHIIALIDIWPPTILQMLRWPAPASTMTWNVEFIHPHPVISPQDWLAYECVTRQAAEGYGHTEATIYAQDGTPIALSRQCVTVFA